jgi:protocatechuate 3,4-dioxygenase beta subunit
LKKHDFLLLAVFLLFVGAIVLFVTKVFDDRARGTKSASGSPSLLREDGGGRPLEAGGRAVAADPDGAIVSTQRGAGSAERLPLEAPPDSQAASASPPLHPSSQGVVQDPASLLITVIDSTGLAIAGVEVALRSRGSSEARVTGMRGEAFFRHLAPDSYSYRLEAPERAPVTSVHPVDLRPGEERALTLRLVEFQLSISGRVLDPEGAPLAGIEVVASPYLLPTGAETLQLAKGGERKDRSRESGAYAIRGLADGEYLVRTVRTERYPAAEILVQAGADSADLVLVEQHETRVYGNVRSERGEPLEGVQIFGSRPSSAQTRTDEDGNYELRLALGDRNRGYWLRFIAKGYEEERVSFQGGELQAVREKRVDVRMEPAQERVRVSGRLSADDGQPVAGERVALFSPELNTRYSSVSNQEGEFAMARVAVGSDYQLWVQPKGGYQDHVDRSLEIDREDIFLDIVLTRLGTGRLTGRMVDAAGNAVPGFGLWLRSTDAQQRRIRVTGDDAGRFVVEDAPAGPLVLESRSEPKVHIGKISLPPGEERDVVVVVDRGHHALAGRVLDDGGNPIPGAVVSLSLVDHQGGIQSLSFHKTVTDPGGAFRFTRLGPGSHNVEIQAEGYEHADEVYDVGSESGSLDVRLEPTR